MSRVDTSSGTEGDFLGMGAIIDFTKCRVVGPFPPYGIIISSDDSGFYVHRGTMEDVEAKKRELGT